MKHNNCPKCKDKCTGLMTERRPDGDSVCMNCGHKDKTTKFRIENAVPVALEELGKKIEAVSPKIVDEIICNWSTENVHALTDQEQTRLVASIFNKLFPDGNVHTMPNDGLHVESRACWCHPNLGYVAEKEHWVHNSTKAEELQ